MENSKEILPPDEYAIDKEVDDLFQHGDAGPVARFSGIKYSRLTAMLRVDDPTTNTVSETVALMYGARRHKKKIAKKIFRIIWRHALELELLDEEPVSILQMARDRLRRITPEAIGKMSADGKTEALACVAEIESETERISKTAVDARKANKPRGYEIGGQGLRKAVNE
ncbi:MAG: hypothetical protein QOH63_1940 [Acidobacteriota bacterium]|jgi:hypothetical protein|nr:hypothetical protein [Acidobacteriota bacterium]